MIGIYKITNLINNHCYIGQSVDIARRWRQHKNDYQFSNYPLYAAFRKYGLENFSFEIIEECSINELNEKEIYWIAYYDSYNKGYNQTLGGAGNHAWLKINDEQLTELITLLKDSDISQQELAKIFNVGEDTISEINQGKIRYQENMDYPIRKRIKTHYYCIDCGKEISHGATRCYECATLNKRLVPCPTKEQLYEDLLNNSFLAVGKKYGVSDNAVRKWCKSYNIPSKASEYKKLNKGVR